MTTDPTLLTETDVSELLRLPKRTLQAWRFQRRILPFVKLGICVRYPANAVHDYMKKNTIQVDNR